MQFKINLITAFAFGFIIASAHASQTETVRLSDGDEVRVEAVSKSVLRIRRSVGGVWKESGLSRYGFIKEDARDCPKETDYETSVGKDGVVSIRSKVSQAALTVDPAKAGKGYAVSVSLKPGERIYGIGDSSRESVQRRGRRYEIWVSGGTCGVPVPMCLSSEGWGLVNNSTWRHAFDVGAKDKDALRLEAEEGWVDVYVFVGRDYRALLDAYTHLTGRPQLLPVWGYGLTYVANQEINDFALCAEAREFRKDGVPCDIIGLEPGWMERDYDMATTKYWDRKKFHIPYWTDAEGQTFIGALSRMGFKLSLWTCCDYDLTRYEEECVAGRKEAWKALRTGTSKRVGPDDYHWWEYKFVQPLDEKNFPEGAQPWFEHYKKFVRQGVKAFKLDACNQYGEHPDRKWANGMSDREVHNLYTAIYGRQMSRGFEDFTNRRSMINSAGGYLGVQHYVATWAGDTGGCLPSLMSAQCLGFSGHSNTSSDLDTSPDGLHYGFLQAWTFHDNWDYFQQPWYLTPEAHAAFRRYAQLRYSLMPYLYGAAAEASRTGYPIVRALALDYPAERAYDAVKTTYKLGDDLLVSAFAKETVIPSGTWYEWRTDRALKGPCAVPENPSYEWGGGLYVRAGAILPRWEGLDHLERGWNKEVVFDVWPTAEGGSCTLYEDDGVSLGYRTGAYALTRVTCVLKDGKVVFTVGPREGSFDGQPKTRRMSVRIHHNKKITTTDLGEVGAEGKEIVLK